MKTEDKIWNVAVDILAFFAIAISLRLIVDAPLWGSAVSATIILQLWKIEDKL
jgi:hypothetical protein